PDTLPTLPYTLSLHDALPISHEQHPLLDGDGHGRGAGDGGHPVTDGKESDRSAGLDLRVPTRGTAEAPDLRPSGSPLPGPPSGSDRKSTRLNSSHVSISYAVF